MAQLIQRDQMLIPAVSGSCRTTEQNGTDVEIFFLRLLIQKQNDGGNYIYMVYQTDVTTPDGAKRVYTYCRFRNLLQKGNGDDIAPDLGNYDFPDDTVDLGNWT